MASKNMPFLFLLRYCVSGTETEKRERGEVKQICHEIVTGDLPVGRVSFALRKKVDELVGEMLSGGVVRESSSPWASPVVLVRKKSGEPRFCVDYRRLNAVTRKEVFLLPRIDDLIKPAQGEESFLDVRC